MLVENDKREKIERQLIDYGLLSQFENERSSIAVISDKRNISNNTNSAQ